MTTSEKGREIQGRAEQARERGETLESLKLIEEATLAYQEDKDYVGMAEVQGSRTLAFSHLYQKTEDINYLILARYAAESAVAIAKESRDESAVSRPLFDLAKVQEELEEYAEAALTYEDAIVNREKFPGEFHNRPAVSADMNAHLHFCQYMAGDKSAYEKMCEDIKALEEDKEEVKYTRDVWLSGAHMRAAQALWSDDKQKAEEHLKKAKEIIDANSELKIRAEQWEKLSKKLNS
jgi:hypothetical protein